MNNPNRQKGISPTSSRMSFNSHNESPPSDSESKLLQSSDVAEFPNVGYMHNTHVDYKRLLKEVDKAC